MSRCSCGHSTESRTPRTQMVFSIGLLVSLVAITYFFVGEALAVQTGLWGSTLYLLVYRSQLFTNKKRNSMEQKQNQVREILNE